MERIGGESGVTAGELGDEVVRALVDGVIAALNGFDDPLEYAAVDVTAADSPARGEE